MMRISVLVGAFLGLVAVACGGGDTKGKGGNQDPLLVEVYPRDGAADVSVAARVEATISRENAEICRFSQTNTTFGVTQGGQTIPGSVVFFVDGLRVDFTPSGMFDFATRYDVAVKLQCSALAAASFTTRDVPATLPTVEVGAAFAISDLSVAEPGDIAPVIRPFLHDAALLVQVMEVGTTSLRMLAGEGDEALLNPSLRVFNEGAFLFPMLGTYKAPFFQVEGSMRVPVDDDQSIPLDRFEISGILVEGGSGLTIQAGNIRASSPCDDVCSVNDPALQPVCANRSSICDENGDLNLVGNFAGAANDLGTYQSITVDPLDGATGVVVDKVLALAFTSPVNPSKRGAVIVELRIKGSDTLVAGALDVGNEYAATFTPDANLAASTEYSLLIVAQKAQESSFTTAP